MTNEHNLHGFSPYGLRYLPELTRRAIDAWSDNGLGRRLDAELDALLSSGRSHDIRLGSTLDALCHHLAAICVAESQGLTVPETVWALIDQHLVPVLLQVDPFSFQGRKNTPHWKSDLLTAHIGVALAVAIRFDEGRRLRTKPLRSFLRTRCLDPIREEWLDHETRLHSLDTMGHNWWSVLVGAAGIIAALTGDDEHAALAASGLRAWARYPGSDLWRKRPTFGEKGDFVESFHYAHYGLFHPIVFSRLYSGYPLIPDLLDAPRFRSLASWFRRSVLPLQDGGWGRQRFGDIQFFDGDLACVWQELARQGGDPGLMRVIQTLKPAPTNLLDLLCWDDHLPEPFPEASPPSPEIHDNSGVAFVESEDLRLTVRAGELWGHNHLDAGSYIFHQDGLTWIDDSGACEYGRADYLDYYVRAEAHNVAYVPQLTPPIPRAWYEGTSRTARHILAAKDGPLQLLCSDTGILSGDALSRSLRWFFVLGHDAVLVWDDLAAYQPQRFSYLLHTMATPSGESRRLRLNQNHRSCLLDLYTSVPCGSSRRSAPMGQISPKGRTPVRDAPGHLLAWESHPAERIKFGLVLGTRLLSPVEWSGNPEEDGLECAIHTATTHWRIWFNPLADGRRMHQNTIGEWQGIETDAYAVVQTDIAGATTFRAIEASFVRQRGRAPKGGLHRTPVTVFR